MPCPTGVMESRARHAVPLRSAVSRRLTEGGGDMFPTQFEYHRPASVQEAVQLLNDDPDAKILAGGHSLLPAMKLRLAAPSALVDLVRVPGLRGISTNGDVKIG